MCKRIPNPRVLWQSTAKQLQSSKTQRFLLQNSFQAKGEQDNGIFFKAVLRTHTHKKKMLWWKLLSNKHI